MKKVFALTFFLTSIFSFDGNCSYSYLHMEPEKGVNRDPVCGVASREEVASYNSKKEEFLKILDKIEKNLTFSQISSKKASNGSSGKTNQKNERSTNGGRSEGTFYQERRRELDPGEGEIAEDRKNDLKPKGTYTRPEVRSSRDQ